MSAWPLRESSLILNTHLHWTFLHYCTLSRWPWRTSQIADLNMSENLWMEHRNIYICLLAFQLIAANQMMWILGKQSSVFVDVENVNVVRVFFQRKLSYLIHILWYMYILHAYIVIFYFVCMNIYMQIKGNTEKGCKKWMLNSRL